MWGIVGLGNPGGRYAKTRHNAGFMVIDLLCGKCGVELKDKGIYLIGKGSIEGANAVFMEPLTFMNRSGLAVREAFRKFGLGPDKLIVVHDDLDMPAGKIKIKTGGGAGGHKGMESIIHETGARDFARVKIGIGRDPDILVEDYVLSKFKRDEAAEIKHALTEAADAVALIVKEGAHAAMNRYNQKA